MCEVYSNENVIKFIDKKWVVDNCNTVYYYLISIWYMLYVLRSTSGKGYHHNQATLKYNFVYDCLY